MDTVITNVSFITDFSQDPPAVYESNPAETQVRAAVAARRSLPYRKRSCEKSAPPQCCACGLLYVFVLFFLC